jgi:hypothetical protein
MQRLRIVAVVVAVTSSSCVGAGLQAESSANTFADSTAEGSGPGTEGGTAPTGAETMPTSDPITGDPSTVGETSGCAGAWDDGQWDAACWQ